MGHSNFGSGIQGSLHALAASSLCPGLPISCFHMRNAGIFLVSSTERSVQGRESKGIYFKIPTAKAAGVAVKLWVDAIWALLIS